MSTAKTVGEFIFEQTGMRDPRVATREGALAIFACLSELGVKVIGADGRPFDYRFLSKRPDFVEISNRVICDVLAAPVLPEEA